MKPLDKALMILEKECIECIADYEEAIEIWLKKSLQGYNVKNLSERYVDDGCYFTWVIPDQHFHISK